MTTVAYRDGVLAADRLGCWRDIPIKTTKIYQLPGYVIGCAGDKGDIGEFLSWLRGEIDKPVDFSEEGFSAIMIDRATGMVERWHCSRGYKLWPEPVAGYFAIGSGADFAWGAMAMGADAEQAARIAMDLDIHTGMGVDVWRYVPPA